MILSTVFSGKNAGDDIASAFYNSAPTVRQSSKCYTATNSIMPFPNGVLPGQSLQSVVVFNFRTMHAMSYWSDYFPCSCRVNIEEPAAGFTVSLFSAVSPVGIPSILISTALSDTKSLNTSLLKVMISSKNERVFIRDLSDLTLQIIFDAWRASMNEVSKWPIAWNDSRHVPLWRFNVHCRIAETSSPGIIRIVCHQVLRHPSEHGTSSMGNHLRAKAHIAKLNELTESELTELTGSTVDETVLAILKRQGCRGFTIVRLQRTIRFDIQLNPY